MGSFVTGAVIRALREKKGYTQKQLAEMVMVSDKAVSKWETGKGLPDISLIEPLTKALGVSVAELLSGEPEKTKTAAATCCGAASTCAQSAQTRSTPWARARSAAVE